MNALIFAGGVGSRLWPASTKNKPKQFLSFFGNQTMLEKTNSRVRKGIKNKNIFVATSAQHVNEIKKQLPNIPSSNFLLEPERKNRGPALGVLMLLLQYYSKDQFFTTVWSDDHIYQEDIYHNNLKLIEEHLKNFPEQIVAIGVSPSSPNTSFRYVQTGKIISSNQLPIYQVSKFIDKPEVTKAKKIFASGKHFWNTGYFIAHTQTILDLYKNYFPECYKIIEKIKPYIGTKQEKQKIAEFYKKMPSFDFEEIFFEKPELLKLAPASFDWIDIGRWDAVKQIQSTEEENLIKGLTVTHKTQGTLIYNYNPDQLVSALHVDNLIVVVTPEAVLVTRKDKAGDLKKITEQLENNKKLKKYL